WSYDGSASRTSGGVIYSYDMLHSTDPGGPVFAPIAIAGTPIVLGDDAVSGLIPMGFTFDFYDGSYTGLYVSSNGFLSFEAPGDSGCCQGRVLPTDDSWNNLVAFWWEDLDPPEGGTISYDTVGAAPNRIFVLEFDTIQHYPSGNPCTMQVHLFEGTDIIEIHYTSAVSDGGTHTVGVENIDGTLATTYLNAVNDPPAEVGTALRFINAYMELTPSAGGLVGRALFMDGMMDTPSRFAVEFDYQIGNLGGTGADGFVFMFYKDTDYAPGGGGSLGFGTTQGYGIEFDHWQNGADPSAEHVALIEDNSDTHLASADANIDDGVWHHVRVEVDTSTVTVYHVDMVNPIFTWTGTIDRSFGGMGFCGATGGSWAHHWVDNFEIMPLGPAGDTFTNNIVTNGFIGVMTFYGSDNLITDNFFTNNMVEVVFGLEVDIGLGTPSGGNMAYHNDFVFGPATMLLAFDFTGTNAWDNGYPSGGNYWSDYPGVDMFSGPVTPQTDPGSDGIGDTPYPILFFDQDNYPFMNSQTPLSSSPIDTAFNTMTLDEISALWPAFGAAIQDYLDSISETEETPETGVQEDGGDVGIVEGVSDPPSKHNIETVPEPTTETEPEPATTETSEAEQEEIILESEDQTQETESTQAAQDDASVTTQSKDSGSIWGLFLFPIFIIVAVPSVYRYRKRK
ncbi:MAG: hypothetical protein KAX31_02240, partial [Thermoplasmata archaeon]|nr:hypothetical protein [Thermoplasmata archaeon]